MNQSLLYPSVSASFALVPFVLVCPVCQVHAVPARMVAAAYYTLLCTVASIILGLFAAIAMHCTFSFVQHFTYTATSVQACPLILPTCATVLFPMIWQCPVRNGFSHVSK